MEPSSFNDNVLEAYLFDELPEDQIAPLEDELLRDEELYDRLETLEMNLIDRYLEDEMTAEEKRRFEDGFLSHADNQRKLEEARVFRESVASLREKRPPPNVVSFPIAFRKFFQSVRVQQVTAAAVALIVIALIVVLAIIRSRERAMPDSNFSRLGSRSSPSVTPEIRIPDQLSPSPTKPASKNRVRERWLYLKDDPTGVMGSGEDVTVTIFPNTEVVRLRFELLDDTLTKDSFRVTVKDQMGYPIFPSPGTIAVTPSPIRYHGATRRAISIDVPVSSLKIGQRYRFEILEPYASQNFLVKMEKVN
jgi:hypothetical protein